MNESSERRPARVRDRRWRAALERWGRLAADSFPGRFVRKFAHDAGGSHATLIAWNGLVSLFPIGLALAVLLGLMLQAFGVAPTHIEDRVLAEVIPRGDGRVGAYDAVRAVQERPAFFVGLALLGFAWRASTLFRQLESCLSAIAGVRPRPYLQRWLISILLLTLLCVVATLAVGSASLLQVRHTLTWLPHGPVHETLSLLAHIIVGTASGFAFFSVVYAVVPNERYRFSDVWLGAAVAAAGFELLAQLFPLYAGADGLVDEYGRRFALVLVLLAFFYFLGLITVVGAEINSLVRPPPADRSAGG